jgi:hypothetical protein
MLLVVAQICVLTAPESSGHSFVSNVLARRSVRLYKLLLNDLQPSIDTENEGVGRRCEDCLHGTSHRRPLLPATV